MRFIFGLFLFVLTQSNFLLGQSTFPTRNTTHIFWQPQNAPKIDDYLGTPDSLLLAKIKDKNIHSSAALGIWAVLDVPKSNRDKKRKFEKIYFVPAFDNNKSFLGIKDSTELAIHNLTFDLCEVWARWARKKLFEIKTETNLIGAMSIYFKTIEQEMNANRLNAQRTYFQEVVVTRNTEAYLKWKKFVEDSFIKYKDFATSPEECYRFIKNEPIEKDYIKSPTVIGPLK